MSISIASIMASLGLISGFVFSPMTKVLASVQVIGSIYESFDLSMERKLDEKKLVTKLNRTVSDNGVDVTLTSVYYDGVYIGITFKAEGEVLTNEIVRGDDISHYDFYLYKQQIDGWEVKVGWPGRSGDLQKVENYYTSAIELEYPEKQLPKDFTLPITFEFMGGIDGTWQFNVPITQLPLKTFTVKNSVSQYGNYSFKMESLVIGESNMRLDYTTNIPTDFLSFKIIDVKGNEALYDTLLTYSADSAVFETGLDVEVNYLLIYPKYRIGNKYIELEPIKVHVLEN